MLRFEILPGLPLYGPPAVPFPIGRSAHREGLVVRFHPRTAEPWIGNFQYGEWRCTEVLQHPDGRHAIVISRGQGYVVDPESSELVGELDTNIHQVIPVPLLKAVVLRNDLWFVALRPDGLWWRSLRISWDGMQNISVSGTDLFGEAYSVLSERWHPFRLDLLTGRCDDGVYERDMQGAIPLGQVKRRGS